ncbi:hypothetical protein MMC10_009779 [Thelotrema lepadinum]|nr:hypothetical protein [Thelotrema lepadinum]
MMTSNPVEVDTVTARAAADPVITSPTSPRKRRRRAPTTGAADDCFACQDIHTTCDRRRPYCTQCIERGKTCSGYKTTLTWGVGVASRGKLRGLSLPIAKSKKVNGALKESPTKTSKDGSSEKQRTAKSATKKDLNTSSANRNPPPAPTSAPVQKPTTFDFVSVDPNAPQQSSVSQNLNFQWTSHSPLMQTSNVRNQDGPPPKKTARRLSLQPISVPPTLSAQDYSPAPMTANALTGYADPHYSDAINPSPQTPIYHSPTTSTPIQKSFATSHPWSASYMPRSQPSINSWPSEPTASLISDHGTHYPSESPDSASVPTFSQSLGGDLLTLVNNFDGNVKTEQEDYEDVQDIFPFDGQLDTASKALIPQFSYSISNGLVGSTNALRELIHYYDQVISPVIVAFDGPSNPYRTHILRLASGSEALQHAIAALSASNLRMRKDYEEVTSAKRIAYTDSANDTPHDATVRKSSIAHNMLRDYILEAESPTPGQPSQRELFHKGESIRALNASLGDPSRRHDDTVLATLLVLCLYHICDTGIAKFKTQFAGVKKILALRNKRNTSRETKWLITMFRWFDAMTATVNDREGQFDEDEDASNVFEQDEWALENLVGCDSRLFNIVSRLGRLNLLSQGKPVDVTTRHRSLAPRQGHGDFYDFSGIKLEGLSSPQFDDLRSSDSSGRGNFWSEWNSIRQELHDWEFDCSSLPSVMLSQDPLSTGINIDLDTGMDVSILDLKNISEAFRFAALLYTERLGNPTAPSSAANFQSLVTQAIPFLGSVKSDVCLLWPLFITGTECVQHGHRELIRKRCLGIQEDSGFFNNTSVLRILEELWKTNEYNGGGAGQGFHSTGKSSKKRRLSDDDMATPGVFKWRKAMMSSALDAEYIVI